MLMWKFKAGMPYAMICFLSALITSSVYAQPQPEPPPLPYNASLKVNYVRTWTAKAPETDPAVLVNRGVGDVSQVTSYMDGLGRPLQTVIKKGAITQSGFADIVSPVVYDAFGRQSLSYISFVSKQLNGTGIVDDGNFKLNPFQQQEVFATEQYQGERFFYGKTVYENSPLNREFKKFAPGDTRVGLDKGIELQYWFNTETDDVKIWQVEDQSGFAKYTVTGVYQPGTLNKLITIDEHQRQTITFTDKGGLLILKKVQLGETVDNGTGTGYDNWICIYNIYDDLDNLRCTIQPEGVKAVRTAGWLLEDPIILAEQCFRYEYDGRERLIAKQVPGAGTVNYIYDKADRLVFTQDAAMQQKGIWEARLYDALNRNVITGLLTYSGTIAQLREIVSIQTGDGNSGTTIPADNSLSQPTGSGNYYASNSFTLNPGFESIDGAEITIEIVSEGTPGGNNIVIDGVTVTRNPLPASGQFVPHVVNYFDSYNWSASLPAEVKNFNIASISSNFLPANNQSPYPQQIATTTATTGMLTGNKVLVLGSNPLKYMHSVFFYDEEGRQVQVRTQNNADGVNVNTVQYSWSGQPLVNVSQLQKGLTNPDIHTVVSKVEYDVLGRMKSSKKIVSSSLGGVVITKPETEIYNQEYDQIGNLKKQHYSLVDESLEFDYNILGFSLGMNRSYVAGGNDHKFGYEIGYDKAATVIVGATFENLMYNGNISGIIWRSTGDGEKRRYDYTYDNANRLTNANFRQHTNGAFNRNAGLNFSVENLNYDLNGNIKSMNQYGWKPGTAAGSPSVLIDQLIYNYHTNSNKLKNVIDEVNDPKTKMGDFRSSQKYMTALGPKTAAAVDYNYDVNGNLVRDLNKDIGTATTNGIEYNYMNLPELITFTGESGNKGTIEYQYDAAGNKLKKILREDGKDPVTTLYLGQMVYENDVLKFMSMETGRLRLAESMQENGQKIKEYVYDYFLKDHQGNTRMILTEQRETMKYYATMETAYRQQEAALFKNIAETEFPSANVPGGYPADAMTTDPNQFVAKLNGSGNKVGPSIVLRVMAGDKVEIGVKSFFRSQGSVGASQDPVPQILSALAAGIVGKAGESKGALDLLSSDVNSPLLGALNTFRTNNNSSSPGVPKAYLNWLLLDEQFNFVAASSSAKRVSTPDALELLPSGLIDIAKNGFLYVYVSNETQNYDVFFNDLSVVHKTGPLVEETHYYPFGLAIAAISSRAFGKLQNNLKYNGGSELNEGLGLFLYETQFRLYDPQLGRFWAIDEMAEKYAEWSPFVFALDNPILLNDPTGLDPDPDDEKRRRNAKWLKPVVVTARRNWEATINLRLALGFARGGRGPAFYSTDSKSLIRTVTERLALRDRAWEKNREAGLGLLNFASAFVPAGKVVQGIGWAFRSAKAAQLGSRIAQWGGKVVGNPKLVSYGGKVLKELVGDGLKEAAANYDNVIMKSDGLDVVAGAVLAPFGVVGKIIAEGIGATHDFTLEDGFQYSYGTGKKDDKSAAIDFLFGTIKVLGAKGIESGKNASENAVNAYEMTVDQSKRIVNGPQP
jgi:RHS repeat-associated protein